MNILVTLNSNYVYPLCAMLRSLAENNKTKMNIFVGYSSLTEDDFNRMHEALYGSEYSLNKIFIPESTFKGFPLLSRTSMETYYRLLASEILPQNIDRVLYLDPDIIVNKDLSEFYNTDISSYAFAAAGHTFGFIEFLNKVRLHKNTRYINAGVLLMNLSFIRKITSVDEILSFIEKHHRTLFLADQDVVNAMFDESTLVLDERVYNLDEKTFERYSDSKNYKNPINLDWVRNNTLIVHFNGKEKPWIGADYTGKLGEFFAEYRQ